MGIKAGMNNLGRGITSYEPFINLVKIRVQSSTLRLRPEGSSRPRADRREGPALVPPKGGSVRNEDVWRSCLSSKGHISKKIPPDIAATQYLGFTMMSPWESALSSLDPKYWVAGYQANRYGLSKTGMTGIFRSYGITYEL
jgi:hypothetical protein